MHDVTNRTKIKGIRCVKSNEKDRKKNVDRKQKSVYMEANKGSDRINSLTEN